MLEFGTTPDATPSDLIKDVTDATFMADVVEASQATPVIVDFWAPWCGPCKTLGPQLEAAVLAAKGKVRMVKVNVDENQQIAAQLRVQSIPTVYAFHEGQPVDGFQGAVPESQIKEFVNKLAAMSNEDGGLGEALEAAEEMLAAGDHDDAAQTFAAILGEEAENAAAMGGLARAHLAMGQTDEAEQLLSTAPDAIFNAPELEAVRAQIELARQAEKAGPLAELQAAVEANPDDHAARFELAQALHAHGEVEQAVDHLLDLFRRDRNWNDEAAKTQLFTIFDALPPQDPIALNGRRRLSSMIFA
ncbi:thioredoxin [Gymnodinialimonas ceratoperidinii]|uniref:Thioredoxin n=1 Tax=Gymnodinialimonas ceratoperidinii TaxID=2856823 RepID=A0A8F6YCX4_9RHOB|nr:thioredoxin [Gymnodinialimonas ceratoperidinii]QXT39805.1 thioredoxin [Gymnodinialimonas ceratoperidinii]